MEKKFTITVYGKVQGVWFRKSAQTKAITLGLRGFVTNKPNGSVYIEAEGEIEALFMFVNWCKTGPELAEVTDVKITEETPTHPEGFSIV